MNVQELIDVLSKIEDKTLDVRCVTPYEDEDVYPEEIDFNENLWVNDIEVSSTGMSGYELYGEVRLITST